MANVSYYHTKLHGMSLGIFSSHGNGCMLRIHEHNNKYIHTNIVMYVHAYITTMITTTTIIALLL